jgi:hypothetical protein
MMNAFDFLEDINDKIHRYVGKMDEFQAEDLGLDRRAAYRLHVDKDRTCIVATKGEDRSLQYYGGFEYVDKEYRQEMGDWVFYFADDDRVQRHLDRLNEELEDEETDPGSATEA